MPTDVWVCFFVLDFFSFCISNGHFGANIDIIAIKALVSKKKKKSPCSFQSCGRNKAGIKSSVQTELAAARRVIVGISKP